MLRHRLIELVLGFLDVDVRCGQLAAFGLEITFELCGLVLGLSQFLLDSIQLSGGLFKSISCHAELLSEFSNLLTLIRKIQFECANLLVGLSQLGSGFFKIIAQLLLVSLLTPQILSQVLALEFCLLVSRPDVCKLFNLLSQLCAHAFLLAR